MNKMKRVYNCQKDGFPGKVLRHLFIFGESRRYEIRREIGIYETYHLGAHVIQRVLYRLMQEGLIERSKREHYRLTSSGITYVGRRWFPLVVERMRKLI